MKCINEIEEVFKIVNNTDKLFIRTNNTTLNSNNVILIEDELFESNEFVYKYNSDKLSVFNTYSNKFDLNYTDTNYILGSSSSNKEFLVFETDSNQINIIRNQINSSSINFDKNISHFNKDILITTSGKSLTKRNVIEAYCLSDIAKVKWLINLPKDFYIRKSFLTNETLTIVANKYINRYKRIIGIDINTGNIKYDLSYEVPYSENLFALIKNFKDGYYHALGENKYQVFDAERGEVILEEEIRSNLMDKISPEINRESIFDSSLWFVGGKGVDSIFGCFNTESKQLEYIIKCELPNNDQFDKPIFHENKLYLRTLFGNKLFVYE